MIARAVVAMVIVGAQACQGPAALPPLSREHRGNISAEAFTAVGDLRELPPPVIGALGARAIGPPAGRRVAGFVAARAEAVLTPRVPAGRVLAAGCSPHHCLVQLEGGAFLPRHDVLLFGLLPGGARLEWRGTTRERYQDLDDLKAWVVR